jgi:hypothetical protein
VTVKPGITLRILCICKPPVPLKGRLSLVIPELCVVINN